MRWTSFILGSSRIEEMKNDFFLNGFSQDWCSNCGIQTPHLISAKNPHEPGKNIWMCDPCGKIPISQYSECIKNRTLERNKTPKKWIKIENCEKARDYLPKDEPFFAIWKGFFCVSQHCDEEDCFYVCYQSGMSSDAFRIDKKDESKFYYYCKLGYPKGW